MTRGRRPSPETIRRLTAPAGPPPDPPNLLHDDAHEERASVLPALPGLVAADAATLANYCLTLARIRLCRELGAREGIMVPGSRGNLVLHPALKQESALASLLLRFASELGL